MNRTHQYSSFSVIVALFALVCFAAQAQTPIVLDNEDATLEGVWTNGVMAPDKLGKDYRYAFCAEGNPTASATYRPKIPAAGKYHVEIFFPKGANRSTNAPWTISYSGGSLTKKINQKPGGDWVRIGTDLEFAAGTSGFVRLDNNSGEAEETSIGRVVVVADGVRFIPGDATAAPVRADGPAIEVDDDAVERVGNWIDINSTTRQRGKGQHYTTTQESATATATFRPNLPKAGKYHVDVWHSAGSNRSTNAPWVVVGSDGETLATVDQTKSDAQWIRIVSDKNFAAGTGGYAQLHNGTGKMGSVVVLDAVRFVSSGTSGSGATASSVKPVNPSATFALHVELAGSGNVTRSPEQIRYPANATVTLTATADEGFIFGGWTGDVNRMKNPLTVTMWKDRRITANFWAAGSGVIMDNTEAEFVGEWSNPEKAWGGPRYDNYRFFSSVQGAASASATYRPSLTKAGIYDIYIWYSEGPNRATKAPWEVACKSGKETFYVNQVKNGGKWFLLASGKEFEEGEKGYVRLTNNAEPSTVVIADAVAFVFVAAP